MAENETLDLGDRRNRRWRHLCDRVLKGATPEEAAECLAGCVVGTLKCILRKDPLRGGPQYPLADMLDALQTGPREVRDVLARCQGHQYAHLLAEEPCGLPPETTLRNHCQRIGDNFFDQIELEAVPGRFSTFSSAKAFRADVERLTAPRFAEAARQIVADPTRPPRSAPRTKAERKTLQHSLLRESLLSRPRASL